MLKLKSIAAAAALAAVSLAAAPSAHAVVFTPQPWSGSPTGTVWGAPWTSSINTIANSPLRWSVADENVWYRVYFEGRTDAYPNGLPGLASSLEFELTDVSADGLNWTFDYAVYNASNALGANLVTNSRVSGFSFDVDPDETNAALLPGGFFTTLLTNVNMNAGSTVGVQDICIKSSSQPNCQGNGGGGVGVGATGAGGFVLTFNQNPGTLVFTDPMVRYQSVDLETGQNGLSGTGLAVAWVPEPGTWALMILGFGGVGALMRRRRALAHA